MLILLHTKELVFHRRTIKEIRSHNVVNPTIQGTRKFLTVCFSSTNFNLPHCVLIEVHFSSTYTCNAT